MLSEVRERHYIPYMWNLKVIQMSPHTIQKQTQIERKLLLPKGKGKEEGINYQIQTRAYKIHKQQGFTV